MATRRLTAIVLAVVIGNGVSALAFTETDVVRQSKFCENATRLPWGDVDQYTYDDCITLQGKLRPPAEAAKTMGKTDPSWMRHLDASSFWAGVEGCISWAKNQPINSPDHKIAGREIWLLNDAWNLCMQRAGMFNR